MLFIVLMCLLGFAMHTSNAQAVEDVPGRNLQDDVIGAGTCVMPAGNYTIRHALSMGQSPALGSLTMRNGMCGQVLRVNCGGNSIEGVVVSLCPCPSSGVELRGTAWNLAAGNKKLPVAQCKVEMTKINPLVGTTGPICYFQPKTEFQNFYIRLGVVNTGGRIVERASIDGIKGEFQHGTGWLSFHSAGSITRLSTVKFFFNDGSTGIFKLSDCRHVDNAQIWS